MSKSNLRDTQFVGFANLLMQEIDEQVGIVTKWGIEHDIDDETKIGKELYSRWQSVIARRAYDLVQHTLNYGGNEIEVIPEGIPDMHKWPHD